MAPLVGTRSRGVIAVFYTGPGCALALAGVLFRIMFFIYKKTAKEPEKGE